MLVDSNAVARRAWAWKGWTSITPCAVTNVRKQTLSVSAKVRMHPEMCRHPYMGHVEGAPSMAGQAARCSAHPTAANIACCKHIPNSCSSACQTGCTSWFACIIRSKAEKKTNRKRVQGAPSAQMLAHPADAHCNAVPSQLSVLSNG